MYDTNRLGIGHMHEYLSRKCENTHNRENVRIFFVCIFHLISIANILLYISNKCRRDCELIFVLGN